MAYSVINLLKLIKSLKRRVSIIAKSSIFALIQSDANVIEVLLECTK